MSEFLNPPIGHVKGERVGPCAAADPLDHILGDIYRSRLESQQPPAGLWQQILSRLQAQSSPSLVQDVK